MAELGRLDQMEQDLIALKALPTNSKELAAVAAADKTKTLQERAADAQAALDAINAELKAAQQATTEASVEAAKAETAEAAAAA